MNRPEFCSKKPIRGNGPDDYDSDEYFEYYDEDTLQSRVKFSQEFRIVDEMNRFLTIINDFVKNPVSKGSTIEKKIIFCVLLFYFEPFQNSQR